MDIKKLHGMDAEVEARLDSAADSVLEKLDEMDESEALENLSLSDIIGMMYEEAGMPRGVYNKKIKDITMGEADALLSWAEGTFGPEVARTFVMETEEEYEE